MPFKNQETQHCPRCGHAAFHAESIPAAGKMWHKICFRCGKEISIYIRFFFI
jgi:ribosomal protein L37E